MSLLQKAGITLRITSVMSNYVIALLFMCKKWKCWFNNLFVCKLVEGAWYYSQWHRW